MKIQTTKEKKKSLAFLLFYTAKTFWKQNKTILIFILIAFLIEDILGPLQNYIIGNVINKIIENITHANSLFDKTVFIYFAIFIGFILLSSILYRLIYFSYQYDDLLSPFYMDKIFMEKILKLDPQKFEDPKFVQEKNKVEWNMWKIRRTFEDTYTIVGRVAITIGLILIIARFNVWLLFLIVLSQIPNLLINLLFGKRYWNIWDSNGEEKIMYQAYQGNLHTDELEQFQELKVLGYGEYVKNRALNINRKFVDRTIKLEVKRNIWAVIGTLFEYSCLAVSYYILFSALLNELIPAGTLFFLYSTMGSVRGNLNSIFFKLTNVQANKNILESFHTFLETSEIIPNGKIKIKMNKPLSIRFENVWFAYPNSKKWVLEDISFNLRSDEDIALVGENGAGKSTIIKLILRVYNPTKGEIYINDIPLKDIEINSFYKRIGFLSQQFNRPRITAGENIYIGDTTKKLSLSRLKYSASLAKANTFIEKYPQKYKTFLTKEVEGGTIPSGGQWQRIAIARVFYKDPSLLILDEPTSAIDALAEEEIFDNIHKNSKNKTVIIVSHRFATVKKAKRIVVLKNGKIVEDGTHTSLMKANGLYKEMYEAQSS